MVLSWVFGPFLWVNLGPTARSARSPIKSHYTFQVRTFWIGLIYLFVGILLLRLGVGVLILLWGLCGRLCET
jgi:uncharacterized membrane protein